jgi:hypothetical protein
MRTSFSGKIEFAVFPISALKSLDIVYLCMYVCVHICIYVCGVYMCLYVCVCIAHKNIIKVKRRRAKCQVW